MFSCINSKLKKGLSIMEILVVVGLITFLAVYAGLEMSRKTKDSDIVRTRTHLTYITAALDRYYGATKDLTGVSSMSVLCDGNDLLRSICIGSATTMRQRGDLVIFQESQ